jgi:LuxR family transcriptional regulator, regulator of acetate metabolism
MMLRPDTARPDDGAVYRQALRLARDQTGVPLAFGGQLSGDHVVLEEFLGAQTNHLDGLRVQHGRGIGGYAVAELRPVALDDYVAAADITHDYDSQVQGEGIRAIVAVPVTVRGAARGVLYAAVRSVFPLGDRAMVTLAAISRGLATEIAIRDEVDRRVRMLETAALVPRQSAGLTPGDLRDLREELLSIAGQVDDDGLRTRLRRACARLEQHDPAAAARRDPGRAGRHCRRGNSTCCARSRSAAATPRPRSGWRCARRPSRPTCAVPAANWACTAATRPCSPPAVRDCWRAADIR